MFRNHLTYDFYDYLLSRKLERFDEKDCMCWLILENDNLMGFLTIQKLIGTMNSSFNDEFLNTNNFRVNLSPPVEEINKLS